MVSNETRNEVWQLLLDVTRLVRYYGRMADRHQRYHFRLRMTLLVLALLGSGTASRALAEDSLLVIPQAIATAVFFFLVALDMLGGFAKKAAVLGSIRRECAELETETRALWGEIEIGKSAEREMRRRYLALEHQVNRVTDQAGGADVVTDDKLNDECEGAAYKEIESRYATR